MIDQKDLEIFGPSNNPKENITYEQATALEALYKSVGISGQLGIQFSPLWNGSATMPGGKQIVPLTEIAGDYKVGLYKFVFIASGPKPAGTAGAEFDLNPPVLILAHDNHTLELKAGEAYQFQPLDVAMQEYEVISQTRSADWNPMLIQDTRAVVVKMINDTYPRGPKPAPAPAPASLGVGSVKTSKK